MRVIFLSLDLQNMAPGLIIDLPAAELFSAVGLRDLPDDSAGIACGDGPCGNVFRYDGAGSDDGVVADGDAGADDDIAADPHIIADGDVDAILIQTVSRGGVNRMSGRIDRNSLYEYGID